MEQSQRRGRPASDVSTQPQAPPAFWEINQPIGTIELSADSRMLVSAVMREAQWYLRLCPLRLAQRAAGLQWVTSNHVLLFPAATVPALHALLGQALAQPPWGAATAHERQAEGLSQDELDSEAATELPDRAALSLIDPRFAAMPVVVPSHDPA